MNKHIIYQSKKLYHFFRTFLYEALPANLVYNFPSKKLTVIMITGTDGKTTSSTMLYHVLNTAGYKVALISTVAAYIGDEQIDTGFHVTNPNPWQLQKILREIVNKGFTHVVLETTSHGIYQYRNWGITPNFAGLTNISNNEHLDYHVSYSEYVKAKASMLAEAELAVIPKQDESTESVTQILSINQTKFIEYSLKNLSEKLQTAIRTRFSQSYNHHNATLVSVLAMQLGVDEEKIVEGISSFSGIPGRMEEIKNDRNLRIIVDFAHTPNALKEALLSLKKTTKSGKRLIAVFGCAGLRDPSKRSRMGQYGAELADYCVFTAEDPRTENVWTIIRQMKENLTTGHNHIHSIPDRQNALDFAINTLAKSGDTVAVFGKGHEQTMCYGTIEYPWNDSEGIQKSLDISA